MFFRRSNVFLIALIFVSIVIWPMIEPVAVQSNAMASSVADPLQADTLVAQAETEFTLPPLPYGYSALNPYIDTQTMTLHHDKHHAGYVKNLNTAISKYPNLIGKSVEELLIQLDTLPDDIRTTVRNQGGGHANHSLFWAGMAPNAGGIPQGNIGPAIDQSFGSFDEFKAKFVKAGTTQFGSGWVWLVLTPSGELKITTTLNQNSPLLEGNTPLLGNDVWEHAYYLKYQNRRAEYLDAWWNVINWDEIESRYQAAQS